MSRFGLDCSTRVEPKSSTSRQSPPTVAGDMVTEVEEVKARPQLVTRDIALKRAEAWVSNMSKSALEKESEVRVEGRPARLGLGARIAPQTNPYTSADPVEKKLLAKLNVEKKLQEKNHKETSSFDANNEDSEEDDMDSRAYVFSKKRQMSTNSHLTSKKPK